jgi:hypothetical protein
MATNAKDLEPATLTLYSCSTQPIHKLNCLPGTATHFASVANAKDRALNTPIQ